MTADELIEHLVVDWPDLSWRQRKAMCDMHTTPPGIYAGMAISSKHLNIQQRLAASDKAHQPEITKALVRYMWLKKNITPPMTEWCKIEGSKQ